MSEWHGSIQKKRGFYNQIVTYINRDQQVQSSKPQSQISSKSIFKPITNWRSFAKRLSQTTPRVTTSPPSPPFKNQVTFENPTTQHHQKNGQECENQGETGKPGCSRNGFQQENGDQKVSDQLQKKKKAVDCYISEAHFLMPESDSGKEKGSNKKRFGISLRKEKNSSSKKQDTLLWLVACVDGPGLAHLPVLQKMQNDKIGPPERTPTKQQHLAQLQSHFPSTSHKSIETIPTNQFPLKLVKADTLASPLWPQRSWVEWRRFLNLWFH